MKSSAIVCALAALLYSCTVAVPLAEAQGSIASARRGVETVLRPPAAASRAQGTAPHLSRGADWLGSSRGSSNRIKAGVIGAVIGGGAAAAVTYWAAKHYGENEEGGFCGACFAYWGAWAIPLGVLAGAVIGVEVSRDVTPAAGLPGPRTFVTPALAQSRAAVRVTMRY